MHPDPVKHILLLYVTGMTPRSTRAIANVRKLCEENLKDRYELKVIDIYQQPHLAKEAQIVATPTLIKKLPLPLRKLIGDMSNKEKFFVGIDLI
jgi:circadian clock protein KaiB